MYYLGIDLGGTNIAAGIVDEQANIIGRAKTKTNLPRPSEEIVDDVAKTALAAVADAKLGMDDIAWVGLGSPGTVNRETGIIEFANNMKFDMLHVSDMLRKHLNKDIYIENDANAAAYGEFVAGAAKGTDSAVIITLGTGVGGGVIINGKLLSGSNYAGAELGHIVIMCDGFPCNCGRGGCWEAYASASALIRQTKEAMEHDKKSKMWSISDGDLSKVSGRTAFDAMRQGDESAKRVVDKYIRYIACGLVDVINIFQPDKLCIGGGICNEGDTLLVPLREYIEKERYSKHSQKQTELCTAKLGNDAGIIGAAFLGRL